MNISNLLVALFHSLGSNVLPLLLAFELPQLEQDADTEVLRLLTIPEASIEAICKKTGADVSGAMMKAAAWAEAGVEFVNSLEPDVN